VFVGGALRAGQGIQEPPCVGEFGPYRLLVLGQLRPAVREGRELRVGPGAQLGDVGELPLDAADGGGPAVARPVEVGGPLQILVGVGGERELHRRVEAAAAVLGGGE
jgi:hypothetical protein